MIQKTIRNKDVVHCLPLLASILGRNYGVKVEIGGRSAYTDGSVIHIPSLPLDCDSELLHLARGYLDHEAAHIRHTDFTVLQNVKLDTVTKHIWNSIEDWRVEEKLSQLYPGCRQHFQWMVRKVFLEDADKEQVEPGSPKANPGSLVLKYVLISVRSWAVAELSGIQKRLVKTLDKNFQGLRRQIDAVLSRIQESCQSTEEAIRFAQEIAATLQQWKPKQTGDKEHESSAQSGMGKEVDPETSESEEASPSIDAKHSGNGEEESSSSKNANRSGSQNAKSTGLAKEEGAPPAKQNANGNSGADGDDSLNHSMGVEEDGSEPPIDDPCSCIKKLFDCDEFDLPKSLGEHLAEVLQGERAPRQETGITVATVGKVSSCTITPEEKAESLRASIALRTRLQGLLQAKVRSQSGVGRRGRVSAKNLFRLSIGNPRIFQSCEEREGLSCAIHLLLDASSSMSGYSIKLAREACYAVVKALSGIKGINPAVTAFPAEQTDDSVAPLMRHGESLQPYLAVNAFGGTPLAQALWWTLQEMLPVNAERKIILILTDGIPDSVSSAQYAIDTAKRIGFEVFGIGIMSECIRQLLPKTGKSIFNINALAQTLFTILQNALLKGDRTC